MIIDRSQRSWLLFVVSASAVATLLYWVVAHPECVPVNVPLPEFLRKDIGRPTFGHSPLGLVFGIISFLIFVFAALLGARRQRPTWKLGRAYFWLQGHIWLTLLTIPLVVYHMDFRFGGGLTSSVMWLYIVVMGSGVFGVIMQNLLPHLMREKLPDEFIYEQIPHMKTQFVQNLEKLKTTLASGLAMAAGGSAGGETDDSPRVLAEFIDAELLPYLLSKKPTLHPLNEPRTGDSMLRMLKLKVSEEYLPRAEELQEMVLQLRQMALQGRMQSWLHGWLLLHVPISLILLVFTAWHAVVAVLKY